MSRTIEELRAELAQLCSCDELQIRTFQDPDSPVLKMSSGEAAPCIYCECNAVIGQLLQEGSNVAGSYRIARGHLEAANNERDRALADAAAAQQARTAVQHRFNVLKSQYDRMIEAVDLIKASMPKAQGG